MLLRVEGVDFVSSLILVGTRFVLLLVAVIFFICLLLN